MKRLRPCFGLGLSVWVFWMCWVLSLFLSDAYGQYSYCAGQWYDKNKYNDNGIGRTENYWMSAFGEGSESVVARSWAPALAYGDYLACDTNRNYQVDPGETWEKYQFMSGPLGFPIYWWDKNQNGMYDTDADVHVSSLPFDRNDNGVEDINENWSVWQVHKDGSCWLAAASNLMEYVSGQDRYHEMAYVNGVDYYDYAERRKFPHYWTSGGRPQIAVETRGFDELFTSADITELSEVWDENPANWIESRLENGIPVVLSIHWDESSGHAITVYGIDRTNGTILAADSDSDRGGQNYMELPYRWNPEGSGKFQVDFYVNGDYSSITGCTSLYAHETLPSGGDLDWYSGAFPSLGLPGTRDVLMAGEDGPCTVHVAANSNPANAARVTICDGSKLAVDPGGVLNVGTLVNRSGANVTINNGTLNSSLDIVNDGYMELTSGNLSVLVAMIVGNQGSGSYVQKDGYCSTGVLWLGFDSLKQGNLQLGSGHYWTGRPSGTVELQDGTFEAFVERIGYHGTGSFLQTGGTHINKEDFIVGDLESVEGTYTMTGGSFTAPKATIGNHGSGTLSVLGGVFHVDGDLHIGKYSSPNTASLSGSGQLTVGGNEYTGYEGTAKVTQNSGAGGKHTVADTLYLGYAANSKGIYDLQRGELTAAKIVIGKSGDGLLTQTGGMTRAQSLVIAEDPDSWGRYDLEAGFLQDTVDVYVGKGGTGEFILNRPVQLTMEHLYVGYADGSTGTFKHKKGAVQSKYGLFLGQETGSAGAYELGPNTELVVGADPGSLVQEIIGDCGSGTFTQTGGTHTVYGNVVIASRTGSTGTYTLDDGVLTAGNLIVGKSGAMAQFTQNGGTVSLSDSLRMGQTGSTGAYTLNSGVLEDQEAFIGDYGLGTFIQTGGTHKVRTDLHVGERIGTDVSEYLLSGGTLDVRNGRISIAESGQGGGVVFENGTLIVNEIDYNHLRRGSFNAPEGTLRINTMTDADLNWTSYSWTLKALQVGHSGGQGYGQFETGHSRRIQADNVVVGYKTDASLTQSAYSSVVTDALYLGNEEGIKGWYFLTRKGNALEADYEYLGFFGNGQVSQSEGINVVNESLVLGTLSQTEGMYNLSGGNIRAKSEYVGFSGIGRFSQSDGDNQIWDTLYLGYGSSAEGSYEISGGTLNAVKGYVGVNGIGSFNQTGGIVNINSLSFGDEPSSSGSYTLGGAGQLNTQTTVVGDGGDGIFTQTGGTHQVTGDLIVGRSERSEGMETHPTYTLSNGSLTSEHTIVGVIWGGKFFQNGGTHMIRDSLDIASQGSLTRQVTGYYGLTRGQLQVPTINIGTPSAKATLSWTGGTIDTQTININGPASYFGACAGDWRYTGQVNISNEGYLDWDDYHLTLAGGKIMLRGGDLGGGTLTLEQAREKMGIVYGYGSVDTLTNLDNRGQVIADGFGLARTLDLSQVVETISTEENTTHWGWYARNGGALAYPNCALHSGDGVYTWGEDPNDRVIDLVNSLRMELNGAGVSHDDPVFSVLLLADDRGDIPAGLPGRTIGLWDLIAPTSLSFTDADLTFRYDNILAGLLGISESDLKLYHYNGSMWVDVTAGYDLANHLIFADGITDFSMFAVAEVPEPVTFLLVLVGLLGIKTRR